MKKLLIILFSIVSADLAVAQSSEGGGVYILNNGKLINSIVKGNYASNGFGVAGTTGEVLNCNILDNLYLNKEIMIPGDMYLGDGTVYSPEYDSNGNLLAIPDSIKSLVMGVCFWSNTNNDFINAQFWILSVEESSKKMAWGPLSDVTDLYNYQAAELILYDVDGKTNTASIVNHYGSAATTANCAAKYCIEYGTPATKGEWFLPSGGQMREVLRSLSVINEVLAELGRTTVSTNAGYWVSNEFSQSNGWSQETSNGINVTSSNSTKSSLLKVRPMIIVTRSN